MPNERLKNTVLEIVDNQLTSKECPFVKECYDELLDRGCSRKKAREKIGAVVLTEIYDVLKEGQEYDNEHYQDALLEMLAEDDCGWEDEYCSDEDEMWKGMAETLDTGLKYYEKNEMAKCQELWESAWQRLKENVKQAPQKLELFEVDEATDFQYEFQDWLAELPNVYLTQHKFEELIKFCEEVKETFAWEETAPNDFNELIGNSLFHLGRIEESDLWFEKWLNAEPDNSECIFANVLHWISRGEKEKAQDLLENELAEKECNYQNQNLFLRAASFFKALEKPGKAAVYQEKYDEFMENFLRDPISFGDSTGWDEEPVFFGDTYPTRQEPLVKPAKIYPNDPCPCGSGKKYKKCCGKR